MSTASRGDRNLGEKTCGNKRLAKAPSPRDLRAFELSALGLSQRRIARVILREHESRSGKRGLMNQKRPTLVVTRHCNKATYDDRLDTSRIIFKRLNHVNNRTFGR